MAGSDKSKIEYLKRYGLDNEEEKKKKKKKQKSKAEAMRVLMVDEDPDWWKPVNPEEDNGNDSTGEDKPVVDEDTEIEIKRMRRLEQRARRPFHAISEDGSGWVPVAQSESESLLPGGHMKEEVDLSPPRRRQQRQRQMPAGYVNEENDFSPPRQQRLKRHHTPSPEPDTNRDHLPTSPGSDLSPPRKGRKDVDGDLSPPRKSRKDVNGDISSLWRSEKDVNGDLSPPRKGRKDADADLSPPRKKKQVPPGPLKEQLKVGLISGREISDEISKTKKDEWNRFQQMDPSLSGREAVPIYRDKKTGQRISKEELLKSQKKFEEKPKEIKLEWGKGLAQKREAETKLEELELEKEKPFARTRDDPNLDKMLKERVRWGDPMAHLVEQLEPVLPNLGDNEKMKESGFIIPQEIPDHSWLKRGLDPAPNRYGMRPGRHWDGVDRSNGFEKGMFKRKNEKQAMESEAYLWSVADM